MASLKELLLGEDAGKAALDAILFASTNAVALQPGDRARGERALLGMQVSAKSTLGAFALAYGGALVDGGWVHLLGSGCAKMPGDLLGWNALSVPTLIPPVGECFVVAVDVLGGVFALDGGRFRSGTHDVHYFAPDTLKWENTNLGHSSFVGFLCSGALAKFYEDVRWEGWQGEVAGLAGDRGIVVYPPPFAEKEKPMIERQRASGPLGRIVTVGFDLAAQRAKKR